VPVDHRSIASSTTFLRNEINILEYSWARISAAAGSLAGHRDIDVTIIRCRAGAGSIIVEHENGADTCAMVSA
jgi:hypothetical protein